VDVKDNNLCTSLHLACAGFNGRIRQLDPGLYKEEDQLTVVRLLIKAGADIFVKDQRGKMPVFYIAERDNRSVFALLKRLELCISAIHQSTLLDDVLESMQWIEERFSNYWQSPIGQRYLFIASFSR
jgi:hypothetical protein